MAATILPSGKSNADGIEIPSDIVWKGWEPGREYTKPLTLKNVKFKTQKLKFRCAILFSCMKASRLLQSHTLRILNGEERFILHGISYYYPAQSRGMCSKQCAMAMCNCPALTAPTYARTCRLPSHVFSTEYPQSIVLSAGTSYTLPITFRPLEKVGHSTVIAKCPD